VKIPNVRTNVRDLKVEGKKNIKKIDLKINARRYGIGTDCLRLEQNKVLL